MRILEAWSKTKEGETERIPAFRADLYAAVEQRALCQLIEAALYEEIVSYRLDSPSSEEGAGTVTIAGTAANGEPVEYACKGKRMRSFGRLRIVRGSVVRRCGAGETAATLAGFAEDALGCVRDAESLAPFLAELERTLANDLQAQDFRSSLATPGEEADDDELEAWLDGHPYHPCYKSRVGFSHRENALYGPEFAAALRPVWVAVSRARSAAALSAEADDGAFLRRELGDEQLARFSAELGRLGLRIEDYRLLPVHPWQWEHVVLPGFHRQLADRDVVLLGAGSDEYRSQQSIRSWANRTHPHKAYLKLALSVLNTRRDGRWRSIPS